MFDSSSPFIGTICSVGRLQTLEWQIFALAVASSCTRERRNEGHFQSLKLLTKRIDS